MREGSLVTENNGIRVKLPTRLLAAPPQVINPEGLERRGSATKRQRGKNLGGSLPRSAAVNRSASGRINRPRLFRCPGCLSLLFCPFQGFVNAAHSLVCPGPAQTGPCSRNRSASLSMFGFILQRTILSRKSKKLLYILVTFRTARASCLRFA